MKRNVIVAVILSISAVLTMHLWSRHVSAQTKAPLTHTNSSFDLIVKAPYETAAPLFGADGERVWAGDDWNPQFIYPNPAHDVAGAVFTVSHTPVHHALWITPTYDLPNRHIQHVYVLPDAMIALLDITFPPSDKPSETHVHVVYERTALKADANERVADMAIHEPSAASEWQKALDAYVGIHILKP